jgi:hypothetical protein
MNERLRAQWEAFLDGHWTRDQPTRPGSYRTATFDGLETMETVVCYLHPEGGMPCITKAWGGYFWSVPVPRLPSVREER